MAELEAVYRERILDHYRHPRHFGPVEAYPLKAEGRNPLCGDELRVGLRMDGDQVVAMGFHGRGCAVCMAAASLLSEHVPGVRRAGLERFVDELQSALREDGASTLPAPLDSLSALRAYPARHRCVTLAAEAVLAAANVVYNKGPN